jgi:subtilisin family serine protease
MVRMRLSLRRLRAVAVTAVCAVTGVALLASPAAATPPDGVIDGAGEPGAISGSYIVTLKPAAVAPSAVDATAEALADRFGGDVKEAFTASLPGFSVRMTEARAKRLAGDPLVQSVEQDKRVSLLTATSTQSNPPSWGLDRVDQLTGLSHSYTYPTSAGAGVTAYVLDTGIRTTHTDFGGRASYGYDFVDNDSNANDCHGHGTHVAGTIGGSHYGLAKSVHLVAVRVLDCNGYGSYTGIIAGINWVVAHKTGPAIINMSIGGPASPALDSAVNAAVAAGVVVAVAAGNENTDACTVSPARAPNALTVGATDQNDARAYFSNYGSCLDIFAPGVGITSDYYTSDTAAAGMSGTSMASPHVAGAAALILGEHPTYPPADVRAALIAGTVQSANVANAASTAMRLLYTGPVTVQAPVTVAQPAPRPPCNVKTNDTNVLVRDRSTATSAVAVGGCAGKASRSTQVVVHIVHPHRGDLQVDVVAPNGSVTRLKSANKRDAGRNVDIRYIVNESARTKDGTWRLRVTDTVTRNAGYVDSWTLTV